MERSANVTDGTAEMNADGESDGFVLPAKLTNHGATEVPAELAEERNPTKRNASQANPPRTQSRENGGSSGLGRVREAARKDSELKFTALMHHIDEALLLATFRDLKKGAEAGVDGVSWRDYEQEVEANIIDLHYRIHRGAYRAKPTRRVWIPKADGRKLVFPRKSGRRLRRSGCC